jgi:putative CocE/NonD family hydrolase
MALHMFGAQFLHAHDAQEIRDDPAARRVIEDAMERLPEVVMRFLEAPPRPGETALRVVPNLERTFFDYYRRGVFDAFWAQECCDQTRHFQRHIDVPGIYSGGWFDPFAVATTGYYAAMARQNQTPQRLIIGPWSHTTMRGRGTTATGDVDFGIEARWGDARYNQERLRWFDRWLRDRPTGVEDDPPVQIFVMGGGTGRLTPEGKLDHGGRWRAEHEWPLARTLATTLFLRSARATPGAPASSSSATRPPADGAYRLDPDRPPTDAQPAQFTFDPRNPVPTVGGAVTGFYELLPIPPGMNTLYVSPRARMRSLVLDGPCDQRTGPEIVGARPPYGRLADRPDVLVFQTDPLPAAGQHPAPADQQPLRGRPPYRAARLELELPPL